MNTAYVLLRSGYADWEPASALAELRRTFGFSVRAMGLTAETVVSMGGLRVIPDLTLSEFEPESADILILRVATLGPVEKCPRSRERREPWLG